MNRKRISGLSVLLVVFLLLSVLALGGCDTAPPPDDDDDENGNGAPDPDPGPAPDFKTVTHALSFRPFGFDAQSRSEHATNAMNANWTDALMQHMPDGNAVMGAAESITQIDELTYEVKIREGITFHNGDPMTAEDAAFSISRSSIEGAMEGGTSARRGAIGPVESVEVIDDLTVRVNISRPHNMDPGWQNVWIYPKNYFEEVGLQGFIQHPIGIGPFKYVEGTVEERVILERYEDYYGGAPEVPGVADLERVPAIDRLIIVPILESATRVSALMAGDIDVMTHVPFDSIPLLEADPRIEVNGVATLFGDDALTGHKVLHFNTTKYPFSETKFRQAVAYAINYEEIVEGLYVGLGLVRGGAFHINPFPGDPMHNQLDDVKSPYYYNPEKARELLNELGITNLTLVLDTNVLDNELSQMIAQYLSDVGLDASVRVWDQPTLTATWAEGRRDITIYGRGNATKQPADYLRGNLGTDNPLNRSFYSNPYLDDIVQQSLALPDSPERLALTIEALEIAMEDLPQIQLVQPDLVFAYRSHIKNFYWSPSQRCNYHGVDVVR